MGDLRAAQSNNTVPAPRFCPVLPAVFLPTLINQLTGVGRFAIAAEATKTREINPRVRRRKRARRDQQQSATRRQRREGSTVEAGKSGDE
jgi:hypothetical protein